MAAKATHIHFGLCEADAVDVADLGHAGGAPAVVVRALAIKPGDVDRYSKSEPIGLGSNLLRHRAGETGVPAHRRPMILPDAKADPARRDRNERNDSDCPHPTGPAPGNNCLDDVGMIDHLRHERIVRR